VQEIFEKNDFGASPQIIDNMKTSLLSCNKCLFLNIAPCQTASGIISNEKKFIDEGNNKFMASGCLP